MNDSSIAIITPSYEPDLALCRTLNQSVLEFLPPSVKHYIFVDRRDLRLFRHLAGERTLVTPIEEILPKGIFQLPGLTRWVSRATLLPISGWLVQQIAKIATADLLNEPTLVMADSDALFIRDVEPSVFANNGMTRLYRCPGAITAAMKSHVTWHINACQILDIRPDAPPMNDYIGNMITWNRSIVKEMCARIERVSGSSWHSTLARTRAVSEYLLYGLFVEKVLGAAGRVWIDERSRCKSHWDLSPLPDSQLAEFATSLEHDDFGLMISAHSGTSDKARRAVIEIATNGRLH